MFLLVNFKDEKVLDIIKSNFQDLKLFQIDPVTFHLSLSRTLYVKDHQKDLFKQKIIEALRNSLSFPNKLKCENVEIYLNDEKTRTFVAINVKNDEKILEIIGIIDNVLKDFGLPVYYKSPKLHFSIFWCQGNQKETLKLCEMDLSDVEVEINEIYIKCGNKITKI